ncbi:HRDC domain-containing protein [Candidatus Woesearchaeota archaeon]|nr:HRDC domain-containing protein [Candidatus Woesearchaeota archaeon]
MAYEYVEKDAVLRGLVEEWRRFDDIAVDLEMEAHLHHYGTHLSLAQVSDGERVWLVDMLAIQDASSFVSFLEDGSVRKIFHDVSFDFRILDQLLDCQPRNVFDTKVAALLLGKDSLSLSGLLHDYFGVEKDEKYQKVDWMKRPLDKDMLSYAAGDVTHLVQLAHLLEAELKDLGRWPWFEEEMRVVEEASYAVEERTFHGVKGAGRLSDGERGVLKELYGVRDRLAEKVDRPVFFIMPDKRLIQFSQDPPKSVEAWRSLKGVHPIVKRQAPLLFKAVQRARPVGKPPVEKPKRLSGEERRRLDDLLVRRDKAAEKHGLEPHLVVTKDQAVRYVTGEEGVLRRWQRSLLGV